MWIFLWEAIVHQDCMSKSSNMWSSWGRFFQIHQGWCWEVLNQRSSTFSGPRSCIWLYRGYNPSRECIGGSCCQESCHNSVILPFRISHKACFWMRGRLHQATFQMLEPWIWSWNLIMRSSLIWGCIFFLRHLSLELYWVFETVPPEFGSHDVIKLSSIS